MPDDAPSLDLATLAADYRRGARRPADVVASVLARIDARADDHVWIARLDADAIATYVRNLDRLDPATAPLYGVPFAVKDNIDLAGLPTTAACPAFAYQPERSAPAVARAIAAGAIPIGKTNLDQFATGLVGVRSPYGTPSNPFDPAMIPGGSSSGSAVAVAAGLVGFAFGTDTAGSGRVPAALNNLVGMKPTRGLISTTGVVPACRSLDCVSIFGLTVDDVARVAEVVVGYDPDDPFSRPARAPGVALGARFRFGVPDEAQRQFFGNVAGEELFGAAIERLTALGGEPVVADFAPFLDAAALLYEGPWLAERYLATREVLERQPEALHPVTRAILAAGTQLTAADTFAAYYRLRGLRRVVASAFQRYDVLLTPTAGTTFSVREIAVDPFRLNAQLGYYTNGMNLLDLCGVAVPAGFQPDGLPFGVTVVAPAFRDAQALEVARRFHAALDLPLGATEHRLPAAAPSRATASDTVAVVVCGAHMSGLPLNHQLVDRGGRLQSVARTAPTYRLVALPDGRPGLERVEAGATVEVEVWELPLGSFGSFVAGIPAPLGIGTVQLADGRALKGFLCESIAARDARDISAFGGWRRYLAEG